MSVVLVFGVIFYILVCCVLLLKIDFIQPFGTKVKVWTCFN